jgi:hypothetical protein
MEQQQKVMIDDVVLFVCFKNMSTIVLNDANFAGFLATESLEVVFILIIVGSILAVIVVTRRGVSNVSRSRSNTGSSVVSERSQSSSKAFDGSSAVDSGSSKVDSNNKDDYESEKPAASTTNTKVYVFSIVLSFTIFC